MIAISLFERCVMNAYFSFYNVSYFYSSTAVCQQIVSKQKCCAVILTATFQVNLSLTQLTVSEQKTNDNNNNDRLTAFDPGQPG